MGVALPVCVFYVVWYVLSLSFKFNQNRFTNGGVIESDGFGIEYLRRHLVWAPSCVGVALPVLFFYVVWYVVSLGFKFHENRFIHG